MSKSLKRVRAALEAAGHLAPITALSQGARTAQDAADAVGCSLDQIAKSIVFQGQDDGQIRLFLTAGGNRVDAQKASAVAGCVLGKADAGAVRAQTGFAIGGVSPVGLVSPAPCFMDPRLFDFDEIWAAAGTPHHVFSTTPDLMRRLANAGVEGFTG